MWASQPVYDGANLAAKGAVVVTYNHRVGAFGNLAHPALSSEGGHGGSGNWGVRDTVAALRWIRRNIAAFGGDPERVTLAGWSHGSSFVNILMISKLARGLSHRALLSAGVQYTKDRHWVIWRAATRSWRRRRPTARRSRHTWARPRSRTCMPSRPTRS